MWIEEIEIDVVDTDDIIDLLQRRADHAKAELDLGGNAIEITLYEYDESFNSHDVPYARFVLVGVPIKKFNNQASYSVWLDQISQKFEDPIEYRDDKLDSIEISFTPEEGDPIVLFFPRDCVPRYFRKVRKIKEKWHD